MTEQQLRNSLISVARGYLGYTEANAGDDKIIDKYNKIRPAGGYQMTHSDPWCAASVSVWAYEAGLSSIIPVTCSCTDMVAKFKKMGRWCEDGTIVPHTGDIIIYNWDSTTQPNNGPADHVGIVISVEDGCINTIEGNKADAVSLRKIAIGNGFIRGFGQPDYAAKATATQAPTPSNGYYPYDVNVAITNLHIRAGAGTNFTAKGFVSKGVHTIVDEQKGQGANKWGKLQSGEGWIALDFTKRVQGVKHYGRQRTNRV